ncbi:MAG: 3H domain-containing protein [Acidimicrobiia bacterium]
MSMTARSTDAIGRTRTVRRLARHMASGSSGQRRTELLRILRESEQPVTGSELSARLGVSRQAIVNDVALLRATGEGIVAGPQGYRMAEDSRGVTAVIRCHHEPTRGREELEILLDRGVSVLDVGVEHSVFGEVRARFVVDSRADIDRHAETITNAEEAPLSVITRGFHSHTVRAPSDDALRAAKRELRERGILRED